MSEPSLQDLEARMNPTFTKLPQPRDVFGFSRYVCQVLTPSVSGISARGTGFLVARNLVLTNYHVIENDEPENILCRFDVKLSELGELELGPSILSLIHI